VGGKIQARWVVPPPPWLTPLFWGAVALQDEKGRSPYIDAGNAAACLMTANFACRRTALDAVGGFSPDYLRDEDRELQLRLWEAGKRGMYVADIAVTTHVPPERTTKRYHRRFYARAGRSHARMRYLDRIDHEGRLVGELPSGATLFGTPGFIYRRLLIHLGGFVWDALTWHRVDAFFHETRVIYFASYIGTRFSQERHTPRTVLRELLRCVSRVVATGRNRRRGASGRSAAIRSTRAARRVPLA
jgi:cellulose synthase/poly-beta-1,6-N-acetylglucosamine synthase-like glycosyltransferase